jgi:hypothetical protein
MNLHGHWAMRVIQFETSNWRLPRYAFPVEKPVQATHAVSISISKIKSS